MAVDFNRLNENMDSLKESYKSAKPFPNIAIDDVLTQVGLQDVLGCYPNVEDEFWTHYIHYNEKKHGLAKWEHIPPKIQDLIHEFQSKEFICWLESLTGIDNLIPDPKMEGAGLHQTKKGGFLNIHADFTVHPKNKNWQRRVNVLLYLNENWKDEYEGFLELWNSNMSLCETKIAPIANRLAIFSTGEKTFHGYPSPIQCPENIARKSIALYYYTQGGTPKKSSTIYMARPQDGSKKWFIKGDTMLIGIYTKLKGLFGLNDDFVSTILKRVSKKK